MYYRLLFVLLLFFAARHVSAQCNPKEYTRIFSEAQALQERGQFIEAKNTYEAAKVYACNQGDKDAADGRVDALFERMDQLREQAQIESTNALREKERADSIAEVNRRDALTAVTNDLVYKSQIALRDGDRTTAFRLAEFAYLYVGDYNSNLTRALFDPFYYNDDPKHTTLLWALNDTLPSLMKEYNFRLMATSPNGLLMAIAADSNNVKIFDLEQGDEILTLIGHSGLVECVAFSSDSKKLVTGSEDNTAKVWDLETGQTIITLEGHTEEITNVAFSKKHKMVATGSSDSTAIIWDLETGKEIFKFMGHSEGIVSLAFSPNDSMFAICSYDSTVIIWDLKKGNATMILKGHTNDVVSIDFSPDGKSLATASLDNTARIWDLEKGNEIIKIKTNSRGFILASFLPDGKTLRTFSADRSIKIWDLEFDNQALTLELKKPLTDLAFSPDSKQLALGSFVSEAKIWDLDSGKESLSLSLYDEPWTDSNCLAFSSDGKKLATGSFNDSTSIIWDLKNGDAIMTLHGHSDQIRSLAFSPDDNRIALGYNDRSVKIWDLETGKDILTLSGHTDEINSVSFSPDGKKLATGSKDNTAKIWDLETGIELLTLTGHKSFVKDVAFSPVGERLATGSWDGTVKLWDIASGKEIQTYTGSLSSMCESIAFSPDGKKLAAGGRGGLDNSVNIWDLEKEINFLVLCGHEINSAIISIAFSPDGKRLAVGSEDGIVKIWDLYPDTLIANAHDYRLAALTLSELQQYNLETLLSLHPDNESKLIATRETWQIKAFADLAASQAAGSNILARVEPHYTRADRLYAAALALQDEQLIRMDYAKMLRRWAEVCKSDGLESRATALQAKADGLWKEKKE